MSERVITFERFKAMIEHALANGAVRVSEPLSELDLAVQYAIGCMQDDAGRTDIIVTDEDIYFAIRKYCGIDVCERLFRED